MPDLPRPAGEKQQGASFVTHESMGKSLGSQKKVLGRVIGVEKRLGNAEKKITIMKNIMKMRKSSDNIGNTIQGIADSVEAIAETTTQQYDLEKDKAEDERLSGEKDDAKKDEKNLEKGWGAFKGGVSKILAPVGNMFKTLGDFIKKFVLAAGVMSLLEWFQDPENMGKIQSLFRFLKDWWPILVTGLILLVGTFAGPGALWIAGIVAVAAVIPTIVNAVKGIFGMGKNVDKELDDKKGEKIAQEGIDGVEKGAEKGDLPEVKENEDKTDEMKNLQEPQKFNKGGPVPGKGNKDTVPAMLTPGEFVMSKGAVQKYGSDTLAGMNAAAGGTNRPTSIRYSGGGMAPAGDDPSKMTQDQLVEAALPELMKFMEQHNAMLDSDPEFYNQSTRLELDRDGKMLNFGKVVANMSEWAFNAGAEQLANNEAIDPDVKEALLKKMAWVRKETLDNPNFKSDMAFNINKDIPGTAANRLYLKAQNSPNNIAIKAGIDPAEVAKLWNRQGFAGGGLVGRLPQVRAAKWLGGKAANAMKFVRNKLQSPPPPPGSKSGGNTYNLNVPTMTANPQGGVDRGSSVPSFSVIAGGGMAKEQTLGIRR